MEPVIAIAILCAAFLGIVKMSLDYRREKWKALGQPGGGDRGIGMSELRTLLREAVEEANAPLESRMERLERRLEAPAERPQLPERSDR